VTDTPKKLKKGVSLWTYRPFSRVVNGGMRSYNTIRNYIQLNEKEILKKIPYGIKRLRGLSKVGWKELWV
jgi:hypothetical protein